MNQVVHIFRKDCRRLWPSIAAVLVLTFLHGYGVVIDRGGGYAIGFSPYALVFVLAGLSGILLPVALFLLVVSVIQEESLVGSDKFWLTRPYHRRRLFFEKLMFVLVWAVLPMLLHDVILIRYFGFSLSSAFGLLLWKTAQFGFFLLVAAALAVLSASFGRAVVLGFAAVLITLLTFYVVMQNAGGELVGAPSATYVVRALLAVAAVGALAVVAFQYRFRITSVAAILGVAAILACALLARFWPSSLTVHWSSRNASTQLQSVQVRPDANLTDLARPRPAQDAATQAQTAYYPFRAEGLSDNVGFDLGLSAQFESPGQRPVPAYLGSQVRFQPPAAGSPRFADAGGPDQLVPFAPLRPGDFEGLKGADSTLSGTLFLEGFRTTVARVSVPSPRKQQEFVIASRRCKVESYQRERNLALVFDCVELEPGSTARFQVRLLQDNRVILPSQNHGQDSSAGSWPAFLSPIVRINFQVEFPLPAAAGDSAAESTQGWEILAFAEQSVGRQQRDFRIEHFRPAEFGLQAWEQRGVLRAESTGTQSNGGTSPRTQ
jgi:hypothetical protein